MPFPWKLLKLTSAKHQVAAEATKAWERFLIIPRTEHAVLIWVIMHR